MMRIVETVETEYNSVDVWERPDGYDFEVAGGTHATWTRGRLLTGYAWDAITAGVLLRSGPLPRSLLMLGLGGGTGVRQVRHLLPDTRITAIEIDPAMVDLARRYMELDSLAIEVVVGDAYAYLDRSCDEFDVVVDDVYLGSGDDVARPTDYSEDLISRLVSRLSGGGVLVTNIVTARGHHKAQVSIRQAFREHFPNVRVVRPPKGFNETVVGGKALCGQEKLQQFRRAFRSPHDAHVWQALQVLTLT